MENLITQIKENVEKELAVPYLTKEAYVEARLWHDAYMEACTKYLKQHKTNSIPGEVEKTFPFADKVTNDLRSAIEVYEFMEDKPDRYFMYINESKRIATTWTGQILGTVHFGKEFRSNMGDVRVAVMVFSINSLDYFGTYYKSSGDYARVKALCK
jgi:hypothetical protein